MSLRWKHFIFMALFAMIASNVAFTMIYGVSNTSAASDDIPHDDGKTKHILFYTPFWNHEDYEFGFGREPFEVCPFHKNCYATNNRSHLESMGDFDAVMFHPIDFRFRNELASIQRWRKPLQRFVYFNVESPQTYAFSGGDSGFYNWTMTYRHDSDIERIYGWFEGKNHPSVYPPPQRQGAEWPVVYNQDVFLQQDLSSLRHLAKRPKKVAWIVSNCNTASQRIKYVRELSKYIQVDVFGRCGTQSCDLTYQKGKNMFDSCTLAVEKDYKFYLSFENSHCKDYVTEKLFSRVNQSVVVVRGGANYSQIAPPHSFINAMDYNTPRELADYLLEVDRNESMYLSFFWWKQHYQVQGKSQAHSQAFCKLCDKLHNQMEPPKSYAHLKDWWSTKAQCGQTMVSGL